MSRDVPPFPLAGAAFAPLREADEKRGSRDFSPLLAGESAALARDERAETLTCRLWTDALSVMSGLSRGKD
jgi:nitronate monooxygenase